MFFINPFIFAAGGDFESIATVTVGGGGASSIEFTSIPGTYQHLQLRWVLRSTRSNLTENVYIRLNSDSSATSYSNHILYGDGASAAAEGSPNDPQMEYATVAGDTAGTSVFGAGVADLLDYASTSKNKTLRALSGLDSNGSGYVVLSSGLWMSTNAVTTINLRPFTGNWKQHSTAALYGIKAP